MTQSATAWTLGQIGRHSPEHAKEVAEADALIHLLEAYVHPGMKMECFICSDNVCRKYRRFKN